MQSIAREIRGIPFFLLKEYLQEMGGTPQGENVLCAEGWRATLEKMEPFRIGPLSVGQTRLTIKIEDRLVEDFWAQLGKKDPAGGGVEALVNR